MITRGVYLITQKYQMEINAIFKEQKAKKYHPADIF
jgi:hypothetical protein